MMKKKDSSVSVLIWATTGIIILWIISWFAVDNLYDSTQDRGTFGDKFGFVNSLFSGLALGGIIYSLILQRQEFQEAREEFKDQNFQTIFFNLLQIQDQIANELKVEIRYLRNYQRIELEEIKGREFFYKSKGELQRILLALENEKYIQYHPFDPDFMDEPTDEEDEAELNKNMRIAYTFDYYNIEKKDFDDFKNMKSIDKAKFAYITFFKKHGYAMGHYFRHLYHIFDFIETTESQKKGETAKIDFLKFANFVQAQMSVPELFLVFYNSLAFKKNQKLFAKYNVLENLPFEQLLDSEHIIDGIVLKNKDNMFDN